MFGGNNRRRTGTQDANRDWGHMFWNWVHDLEDPNAPTMLNRGGEIANTGVSFNFTYKPEANELTVNLQLGGKGDDVESTLRRAKHEVEREIAGQWDWDDMTSNEGHGCTYLFGRIENDWDVQH